MCLKNTPRIFCFYILFAKLLAYIERLYWYVSFFFLLRDSIRSFPPPPSHPPVSNDVIFSSFNLSDSLQLKTSQGTNSVTRENTYSGQRFFLVPPSSHWMSIGLRNFLTFKTIYWSIALMKYIFLFFKVSMY